MQVSFQHLYPTPFVGSEKVVARVDARRKVASLHLVRDGSRDAHCTVTQLKCNFAIETPRQAAAVMPAACDTWDVVNSKTLCDALFQMTGADDSVNGNSHTTVHALG
jgi:hypothetical protein